jgi:hypothetical protein
LILKHSSDQYRVRYVKGEIIETIRFEEKDKNQILNKFLQENVNILELEKDKPTLEEIIYKIKK